MTILSFDFKYILIFTFKPEQMFQMNNCAKLFWNPCINVEVIAHTSSIYDHFIFWPPSVILNFNLPEHIFQMNNCAKLFWNSCINIEVMARTNPDGHMHPSTMHPCMRIHQTKIVTTVSFTASRLNKKEQDSFQTPYFYRNLWFWHSIKNIICYPQQFPYIFLLVPIVIFCTETVKM